MLNKRKERPVIASITHGTALPIETFQNNVLRPIIKMQHDVIISATQHQMKKMKLSKEGMSKDAFQKKLDHLFARNIAFKNLLIGLIIADFSPEEFETYELHYPEYNRRINTIIKKRVLDTI
ncbi:MAG: hypothetical protein CMB99_12500 [Flavobacteriaceae bacterium]|nr:hypothetical protein [Flavobacteriaceae bacterium]|tara:strand:+ start:41193 stop:41558 length:366 start_codon:yes stop_codon:yes gene_type:complete